MGAKVLEKNVNGEPWVRRDVLVVNDLYLGRVKASVEGWPYTDLYLPNSEMHPTGIIWI